MKQFFTLILLLGFGISSAQQKKEIPKETLEAIKTDIWIPFMESYAQLDSDMLKSVHSSDIVRVTIDQNEVRTGEPYLDYFGAFLDQTKEQGGKLAIAFAISSTAIDESGKIAYQTGYYRFGAARDANSEFKTRGYGRFNVGLRLANNGWKIWLDSDKRVDITADEFNGQEIVYELDPVD
ncbi:nuclear transport factor 2 family protein [Flagellimonas flava]|uniref:SnoaL-like domain-containing protein n=1 Tax=Flagellimonas flava TaxID=570519 RepID=A0A1M5IHZ1_9FLAO|nr:nuclear transport factor 2 family protein [Allomuricauda flava]SHG27968.1 SnoaL-like domain-containing protein [Allomuricauda flava]